MYLILLRQTRRLDTGPTLKRKLRMQAKLIAIFLFAGCMQVAARGYGQQVTMNVQDASLLKVFKLLRQQTGYLFVYDLGMMKEAKKVNVDVKDASLESVLALCFRNQPLTYTIVDQTVVIRKRPAVTVNPPQDTTVTIHGRITNKNGEPLVGATVSVKGTKQGTITGESGAFELRGVTGNAMIAITSIGYENKEIPAGKNFPANIVLSTTASGLNEIVVVGYGQQKKADITGAIASVGVKDLKGIPVATVGQMLQGKLSGVRITQTSGRPGEGIKIQVRGAVSFTAGADPLYVVDGMPINGNINFLNPDEIESISVLKDPASASLYGSRAANGVVLVTTRAGKSGNVQLDFSACYGVEQVPQNRRLKMMDAKQYAQFQKEIAEANGRPVDPLFANPAQYGKGTDWFETLTRTGVIQRYNLSLGGGTEKFKTSATVGYFNQEGVVINTGFERISLRINSKYQPTQRLTIGFNVAPTQTVNTNFSTDGAPYGTENLISSALITTPLASPYNPDGSLALTASDPVTFGNPNWLRVAKEKEYNNKNFQLLSNAFVEYEILKGLTAKTTMNLQTGNQRITQFNPSTIGRLFSPPPSIPSGSDNSQQFYNWANENTLNYTTKIGKDHHLGVLIGFTAQKFRLDGTNILGTNYPDDRIHTVNAAGQTLVTSSVEKWSLLSGLARLNYSYKDKYLFQASFRRDGSSRFGPNNRWGNFPALSAGWVISQENFWNIKPVTFLKLRASYGITGNFDIGNYTHITTLANTFYAFGNTPLSGAAPNNLGDQDLGWENNKQFNIGTDINLFNDRLQFTYNYYNRITTDLLFNVSVPVSSGFSNLQSNIGKLSFWGHEFAINVTMARTGRLAWNTAFNMSFDRNKALNLATPSGVLPGGVQNYGFYSHRSVVGQPILQFYGGVWEGVYKNQKEFDESPKNESSAVGTIKYKDINGDGVITFPEDMTLIGNPWPKFTFGMTNNFNYRKFNLSFTLGGTYGNKILTYYENWTTNLDGVFNVQQEVAHRWKSEADPGDGKYGSVAQGTTFLERDRWNSRYLKDGSYLAFKNIQLGYDITPKNKQYYTHVYISLQNAFILTKYPSGNPEVNTRNSASGATPGFDDNSYPLPRTITIGASFSLR
jgi:TonB-linked SusC/RagA family outer membrane protein